MCGLLHEWLGTAQSRSQGRYVHPSEDSVLAAVEQLGGHRTGHNEESGDNDSNSTKQLSA